MLDGLRAALRKTAVPVAAGVLVSVLGFIATAMGEVMYDEPAAEQASKALTWVGSCLVFLGGILFTWAVSSEQSREAARAAIAPRLDDVQRQLVQLSQHLTRVHDGLQDEVDTKTFREHIFYNNAKVALAIVQLQSIAAHDLERGQAPEPPALAPSRPIDSAARQTGDGAAQSPADNRTRPRDVEAPSRSELLPPPRATGYTRCPKCDREIRFQYAAGGRSAEKFCLNLGCELLLTIDTATMKVTDSHPADPTAADLAGHTEEGRTLLRCREHGRIFPSFFLSENRCYGVCTADHRLARALREDAPPTITVVGPTDASQPPSPTVQP